jgi:asparagine synthase (glutamine-hydrolysing)
MCGIVGVFSVGNGFSANENELKAMRDKMASRGPDDVGILMYRNEGLSLCLGHRRLAILDLSSLGRQPMSTADGTLWIVFNGEIFNYRELRDELIKTGNYAFRSQSDTEVILYAVKEWGIEKSLKRFRGMYAFALFDKIEGSLTLVRDPLGVKPLYFFQNETAIAFASEIKALLEAPWMRKDLDEEALYHYLTFANSPAPRTMFKGIFKLEAGTYLKIDGSGRRETVRYWNPSLFEPDERAPDAEECAREILRLLRQAVKRRMVSDVPFGVFLSGGLDSSLNVALMAELMNRPVETFSIGVLGDPSNEFEYARLVARRFETNHHEVVIDEDDFISFLPQMAYLQDEPLGDPVCVPLYYVSKLARECGTPVIQVGEGSDEIFAGYAMYRLFNDCDRFGYRHYLRLPPGIRSHLYKFAEKCGWLLLGDVLRRAAEGDPLFLGNALAFWDLEKSRLLKEPIRHVPSSRIIGLLNESITATDPILRITNIELKNRLPELLLMRVDKMSMANSIETRVPYLDEDLVEFALRIPSSLKIRNGEGKWILKKSAEGIIPHEIIHRQKHGFCGSATSMLTDKLAAYARDRILSSRLTTEMFNQTFIERLFINQQLKKRFNSFKVWNLLNLVLWFDCWFQ